jgi:hypothetical protein
MYRFECSRLFGSLRQPLNVPHACGGQTLDRGDALFRLRGMPTDKYSLIGRRSRFFVIKDSVVRTLRFMHFLQQVRKTSILAGSGVYQLRRYGSAVLRAVARETCGRTTLSTFV